MKRIDMHVRIPDRLHRELVEAAEQSGRSLNAEIVQRLRRTLEGWTR